MANTTQVPRDSFIDMSRQGSSNTFQTAENASQAGDDAGTSQDSETWAHEHTTDWSTFDLNGPNVIHHDNIFLKPIVHTTYRYQEVEEVLREKTIDKHVHHVQMHYQDVAEPPKQVDSEAYYAFSDPTAQGECHLTRWPNNVADPVAAGSNGGGEATSASYNNFQYRALPPDQVDKTLWKSAQTQGKPYFIEPVQQNVQNPAK